MCNKKSYFTFSLRTKRGIIKPKTKNQLLYIKNIYREIITFGVGVSGTGKTYLATAVAVDLLKKKKIYKIILARPIVEAGEKLGFLPGNFNDKTDPYLSPIYDVLFEILGTNYNKNYILNHIIEVVPLAYMRGRTFNDAFIILDEAQNTTIGQMKMFLTRLGFNTKVVINGDVTQVDLPKQTLSGLQNALDLLKKVKNIGFTFFTLKDVIRSSIVADIVKAYNFSKY